MKKDSIQKVNYSLQFLMVSVNLYNSKLRHTAAICVPFIIHKNLILRAYDLNALREGG